MKQLGLYLSQVKWIQPLNVKKCCTWAHLLKHHMESDGKKFPIPIYVEGSAIDVRIHNLPNVEIVDHMRQYGEVIKIRDEIWKSYFPGFINGVRVVRMKRNQPIPSYITIDNESLLVTYQSQIKTCRKLRQ